MECDKVALYIHIPFCVKKCFYCDFISYPDKTSKDFELYVNVLCKEIESYPKYCIRTIYFGGGTPSILPVRHIKSIFKSIKDTFLIENEAEITIEVNPATVDKKKLQGYKNLGINRISIGAQAFDDYLLKLIGRIHLQKDIYNTHKHAVDAGFDNINIDLIYGLPEQDIKKWTNSLMQAINLNPAHLSLYCLEIHENTPIYNNLKQYSFPDEDEVVSMYEYAANELKKYGYRHYEISNFAKKSFDAKHNIIYWKNKSYIGAGLGAHSYLNKRRFFNTCDFEEYIYNKNPPNPPLLKGEKRNFSGEHETAQKTQQTKQQEIQEIEETVFMNLRLLEQGINLKEFKKRFNTDILDLYKNKIEKLIKLGLLIKDKNSLKLSDKAVLISNEVFLEFLN